MNNLEQSLTRIGNNLQSARIAFLLIGGFAVNHYGYTRATLDIDFMIAAEDVDAVKDAMLKAGFDNFSMLDNVAFFKSPDNPLRIDFVQTDSRTLEKLKDNAETMEVGHLSIPVASLRDLIAMKLFAVKNGAQERQDKDIPDIVHLSVLNDLDAETDLRPLCQKYADLEIYSQLCQRITNLKNAG
jgi:hypothetical protein